MWGGGVDVGDDSNGFGFGRRECDRGRRTKKESVCSWVERHGLLKEPRACVFGFLVRALWALPHVCRGQFPSYTGPAARDAEHVKQAKKFREVGLLRRRTS